MGTTTTVPEKTSRTDVQQIVNDLFIGQLENGIAPWRVSWMEAGVPTNLVSKYPYRGMNNMLLAMLGYDRNVFLTENQLAAIGASIKAKEKPHVVMYWDNGITAEPANPGIKKTPKLRFYQVYNIAQCAGILGETVPPVVHETNPIAACERIIANMPKFPAIRHKEANTFYNPLQDFINLPKQKDFLNDAGYFSALFHQLVHASGHYTRLDRMGLIQMPEFGCDPYSLEELVAEIGACYLRSLTGIASEFDEIKDTGGWLPKFRKDKQFIFTACTLALKAIDFILNVKVVEEPAQNEITGEAVSKTTK